MENEFLRNHVLGVQRLHVSYTSASNPPQFSRDDAPFTENKGTGPVGEGVLLKITVGVCSMLPETLTLPQTKIRDLPCLTSAFKRRVIERNITYSRALF